VPRGQDGQRARPHRKGVLLRAAARGKPERLRGADRPLEAVGRQGRLPAQRDHLEHDGPGDRRGPEPLQERVMDRGQKETFVAELRERMERAPVLYLTDFTGLDVKAMTKLRRSLRSSGAEY